MPPVELMFGRGTVEVDIDPQVEVVVVEKPPMDLLADPAAAVRQAIESPQQAAGGAAAPVPPLREYAQGKQTACILICDITRPVPNGLNLPVLVRALLEAGVPASGITVLVATGLHRPNEGEELSELIGDEWVEQTVTCVNHFARNDEDHVHVGTTSRGTVVRLDRRFVDAEVRIATGLVEPHFMAGYSGERSICCSIYFELCGSPAAAPALTGGTDQIRESSATPLTNSHGSALHASALTVRYVLCPHVRAGGRKVISPGIAHAETITTFHSARFMEDPKAVEGNLDGYAIIGTAQHTAAV